MNPYAFLKDESGATSVDWVVLTAAVAAVALGVLSYVASGLNDAINTANADISAIDNISGLIGANPAAYQSGLPTGYMLQNEGASKNDDGEYTSGQNMYTDSDGRILVADYGTGKVYQGSYDNVVGSTNPDGSISMF